MCIVGTVPIVHAANVGEKHRESAVQAVIVNQVVEEPSNLCEVRFGHSATSEIPEVVSQQTPHAQLLRAVRYCVKLPYHCSISNHGVHPQRWKLVTCYAKHVNSSGEYHVNWCPHTCNTVDRQGKLLDVEFKSKSQLTTPDSLNINCAETDK